MESLLIQKRPQELFHEKSPQLLIVHAHSKPIKDSQRRILSHNKNLIAAAGHFPYRNLRPSSGKTEIGFQLMRKISRECASSFRAQCLDRQLPMSVSDTPS
jgi:hypothetical protein